MRSSRQEKFLPGNRPCLPIAMSATGRMIVQRTVWVRSPVRCTHIRPTRGSNLAQRTQKTCHLSPATGSKRAGDRMVRENEKELKMAKIREELKMCPFCGRRPRYFRGLTGLGRYEHQVACPYKTCLVQPMTAWREKKDNARDDWNRRP